MYLISVKVRIAVNCSQSSTGKHALMTEKIRIVSISVNFRLNNLPVEIIFVSVMVMKGVPAFWGGI